MLVKYASLSDSWTTACMLMQIYAWNYVLSLTRIDAIELYVMMVFILLGILTCVVYPFTPSACTIVHVHRTYYLLYPRIKEKLAVQFTSISLSVGVLSPWGQSGLGKKHCWSERSFNQLSILLLLT